MKAQILISMPMLSLQVCSHLPSIKVLPLIQVERRKEVGNFTWKGSDIISLKGLATNRFVLSKKGEL